MEIQLKAYKKTFEYGYSFGVFPTVELLKYKQDKVLRVILSEKAVNNEGIKKIIKLCAEKKIKIEINNKVIDKISKKENTYCLGIFKKYTENIEKGNHLILENPSDMGNMGTIIRTSLGFGIENIGIISPGVDIFNPKVIRASMGSIFNIKIQYFSSIKEYLNFFNENELYSFILNGEKELTEISKDVKMPFTLIFGNEGSGLEEKYYSKISKTVKISQDEKIDSLNLSIAVGIGLYNMRKSE